MKNALFTMIGFAALTMPVLSQQIPTVDISDASAAPQIEIPEGAFEIAVPNLGSIGLEIPKEASDPAFARIPGRGKGGLITGPTASERLKSVRAQIRLRRVENSNVGDRIAAETASEVPEYSRPEPEFPSAVELLETANAGYSLSNAAPNPVGTIASISFTLPHAGRTSLAVFDNAGRVVATMADENLDAGRHTRTFDASGLPAGLYLYRLSSGSFAETKTMTVVR